VIAVLDHGSGNLRSVAHAVSRAGGDVEVTGDPERVLAASGLVVPGVGHFGACASGLRDRGLDATIAAFAASGRPVFGVCVGMQVLFAGSDEAPGVLGLGVFDTNVERLLGDVKVPHMGWNAVSWRREPLHPYTAELPDPTWLYFAHSYAPPARDDSSIVGTVAYGAGRFAAAVARDTVFATQFHPERSGTWGLELYRAFVRDAER
jgi:glutamine amidotransferase